MIEVAVAHQDQVQELVLIETGLDALQCREYDHFAKDCLNLQKQKKSQNKCNKCII